jgi:hypothetical protein
MGTLTGVAAVTVIGADPVIRKIVKQEITEQMKGNHPGAKASPDRAPDKRTR